MKKVGGVGEIDYLDVYRKVKPLAARLIQELEPMLESATGDGAIKKVFIKYDKIRQLEGLINELKSEMGGN